MKVSSTFSPGLPNEEQPLTSRLYAVMGEGDDEELEVVSVSGTSDDGSEYDIIEAVEMALTGDSKSN